MDDGTDIVVTENRSHGFVICCIAFSVLLAWMDLCMGGTTVRYIFDFVPLLTVSSSVVLLRNMKQGSGLLYRVCIYAIALTFVLPLDSRVFTREIFEMVTECAVVFPEGIGIVPWVICGGRQIGEMTAEIMKKQDVAVWAHHGAFCCGYDFDLAFGLMHTVEKAAEVLVKVLSMSQYKLNTITPEMFRQLNEPFGIQINEDFLYEKKDGRIGQLPED